jgi:hypothetical protein
MVTSIENWEKGPFSRRLELYVTVSVSLYQNYYAHIQQTRKENTKAPLLNYQDLLSWFEHIKCKSMW